MIKNSPAYVFEKTLPLDVIYVINSFLPRPPKQKKLSPSLQTHLKKIQSIELKGKNEMYMRDFEDFLLD